MPRVLNLETGLEHDVPEGHWSLGNSAYEVLPEKEPEPASESLEDLTIPELRDLADERGVDLTGITRKADIIEALEVS